MTDKDINNLGSKLEGAFIDDPIDIRVRESDSVHNHKDGEPYLEIIGSAAVLKLTVKLRESGRGWHIEGDVDSRRSVDTTVNGDRELINWIENEVLIS